MSNPIPQVRRRPTKPLSRAGPDSNVVRASVLEVALELGIAHSSTVANWIFNSPLAEESEELETIPPEIEQEQTLTPALTFASNTTSDDSSSLSSPQNNVASAPQRHAHKPSAFEAPHVHFDDFSSEHLTLLLPSALRPNTRETLRKASDPVGNLSDVTGNRPSDDSKPHTDRQCLTPSLSKSEAGYGSDVHYLSDSGLKKSVKAKAKKGKPPALDLRFGSEREPGYSSDGGYLSASSNKSQKTSKGKSRAMAFFRRKSKKSHQVSDNEDDGIPPVPALPFMPVPSSPKPLRRLGTPSSPTRSGFTPLALNFNASPPGSSAGHHGRDCVTPPPARVVSPSPIPTVPRSSEQTVNSKSSPSPPPPSTPTRSATSPVARTPSPVTLPAALSASQPPATPVRSSPHHFRHIGIRPAPPPPTQPLPQPPSFAVPTTPSSRGAPGPPPSQSLPPLPAQAMFILPSTPTTPSRRMPPFRPLPTSPVPVTPLPHMKITSSVPRGSSPAPLHPGSSLRPQAQHTISDSVVPQRAHANTEAGPRRYQSHNAVHSDESFESPFVNNDVARRQHPETPPLFLQRRMHSAQGIPRHPPPPPPDSPLPQVPDTRHVHPSVSPSKFHEHFSSVSSMGHSPAALLTPRSASRSGSSSGPSVRSMRSSTAPSVSTSDSHGRSSHRSGGVIEAYSVTRSSSRSETSSGKQTKASIAREHSHLSILDTRSDASISVYDEGSSIYDEVGNDPRDVQADDEDDGHDDDASLYPSDEKTAGRRTMYLVENGHSLDGDVEDAFPPPMPRRTGGYF